MLTSPASPRLPTASVERPAAERAPTEERSARVKGPSRVDSQRSVLLKSPPHPSTRSADQAADRAADAQLLARLRAGDERALEAVFRAHYATMCSVVKRIVFAPDVAEELVQDVFFKLWSKREQLAEIDALKTYLYRAARNTALNHLRRQKLEHAFEERELAKGEPVGNEGVSDSASTSEVERAVRVAIQRLPERCREIFQMSRDGGLTYGQIARELGISIKTVETQMGRALKSLRVSLAEYRR
jgi:RNA polymerase sigma-70 factor (ECF subfamily)